MTKHIPLLFLGLTLAACGSSGSGTPGGSGGAGGQGQGGAGGSGQGGSGGAPVDFVAALEADSFSVREGTFKLLDLADCCGEGKSCAGNNPSSPYAAYYLPRAPGQTTPNPEEDAGGLANTYRLRADEAVVWLGETPPSVAYFGFTDYLMARDDGTGTNTRTPVFASLAETLNIGVIGVDGPMDGVKYGRRALVVHTPNAAIGERVKKAAIASGIPASAVNIAPIDSMNTHLGLEETDDTFGVLFRSAIFEDAAAGDAWLNAPPVTVYRLTPSTPPVAAEPYGKATPRPKDATNDENPTYAAAAAELEQAILAAYAGTHDATIETMTEGTPDPYACIAGEKSCAGDNRDTIYPATGPFLWPVNAKDFIIVHGVDHSQTGKATYANASVYALQHLVGVAAVSSKSWKGSAAKYLPNHPLVDKLYAYKIAQTCNGEAFCLEVPDAPCPNGIAPGSVAVIAFRAYLEPGTNTAPNPALLVPDGVLRFKTK
ncbi:hypothetical protein [Polyangium mundeleinium]|uniref:Lipoprotein n=1 Tax=Polyangium mundeleinium TaxID=2995306 RepID=A0ABT5EIV9_9BACT|nr:hypothetical protein [Polyangium mundeleinium]MDC0741743.1 hypothetical protein [Polyangium mundeleinium]